MLHHLPIRPPPDGGVGWIVVLGAFSGCVIATGLQYMSGLFAVALSADAALSGGPSSTAVSWAASLQSCAFLAGALPAGWGVIAFGARVTTCIGAVLIVSGFFVAAWLKSLAGVFIFYSLATGLGCALASAPSVMLVQCWFVSRRAFATGIVVSGGGVGAFLLGPMLQAQVDAGGWVHAFRAAGGLAACVLPLAAACLVPRDVGVGEESGTVPISPRVSVDEMTVQKPVLLQRRHTEWQLLARPSFRLWLLTMACQGCIWFVTITHTNATFRENGTSAADAASLISLGGLATVAGRVVVGYIADALAPRISRLAMFQICLALAACATALLAVPSLQASLLYQHVFVFANSFFGGSVVSLISPILIDLVGVESLPIATGLVQTFQALVVLPAPPAAMVIRVALGSWGVVWGAVAALSVVAIWVCSLIDAPHHLAPLRLRTGVGLLIMWCQRGSPVKLSQGACWRGSLVCVGLLLAGLVCFRMHPWGPVPVSTPLLPVILTCFNPAGFASRWANLLAQQARLQATRGVDLYTVELAYDNEPFRVTSSSNARHLQLRLPLSSALWHKEALVNAAVAALIPHDWRAVAWVDAEVVFENDAWAVETLHALTHGQMDAVQPFVNFTQFSGTFSMRSIAAEIDSGGHFQRIYLGDAINAGHFGFVWAWSRRTWERLGGLFPLSVVGAGDQMIAATLYHNWSFLAPFLPPRAHLHERWYAAARQYFDRVAAHSPLRVGFVAGSVSHVDHGSFSNRRYAQRFALIADLNPDVHLRMNADGLPVPTEAMPTSMRDAVHAYFIGRREDDKD